jgi:hypothetical protein
MEFTRASKMCSFCGRQGGPDVKLAGGLGAMICDECVEQFHDNNQHPERIAEMSRPPWESMQLTELLAALTLIMKSAEQNSLFAQEWVDMLREKRASWAEIGKALGVSRQSAWEKYSHRTPDKSATA